MMDIKEILFDEQTIRNKVEELALQISQDYAGKELVLVCVLKGALTFTADLSRAITIPVTVEFIQAASYGACTCSSKEVAITHTMRTDIRGKQVLVVDTIIDTGETLATLLEHLGSQGPASLAIIALLDKKTRRTRDITVTYKGFEIPDAFVVGYGMDFGERYRNLPYIAALEIS